MPLLLLLLSLVAAGCGGPASSAVSPEGGPTEAVDRFMRAVADSNLAGMAELWGTSRGPAAVTGQPENYQRRIQIMHAYLKGSQARVMTEIERTGDRVVFQVALRRADCTRNVPFTVVRQPNGGWLVSEIDLAAVGTPGRPCATEDRRPPG